MSCKNVIKSAAFGNINCGEMVQGGIRLCQPCMDEFQQARNIPLTETEPTDLLGMPAVPKRDFENLDTRLYLVLRKFLNDSKSGWDSGDWGRPCQDTLDMHAAAESVMRDFEDSHGPLPEWAVARNFGLELVVGTQLITRDGRRHGNGWLVKIGDEMSPEIADRNNPYGEWKSFYVLTDAGSLISKMTEQEVESGFEVGDWICTLNRIVERFDHDKLVRELEHD